MADNDGIPITIEFTYVAHKMRRISKLTPHSGGLELLFANQKKYSLSVPAKDESGAQANVAFLVRYLCDNLMKDPRKEMFVLDDSV
jgi:ubiquitin related modifier 1